MKQDTEYNPADKCVSEPAAEYRITPSSGCPVCHRSHAEDDDRIARENYERWVDMIYESGERALEEYKQGKGISHEEMKVWIQGKVADLRERKRLRLAAEAK